MGQALPRMVLDPGTSRAGLQPTGFICVTCLVSFASYSPNSSYGLRIPMSTAETSYMKKVSRLLTWFIYVAV